MLSGISVFKNENSEFQPMRQGINAYMRHPLYAGTLIVLWSLFFIFPLLNNLIACCCITVYLIIGIQLEERKLVIEFGEIYKAYQRKVPMLFPFGILKGTKLLCF